MSLNALYLPLDRGRLRTRDDRATFDASVNFAFGDLSFFTDAPAGENPVLVVQPITVGYGERIKELIDWLQTMKYARMQPTPTHTGDKATKDSSEFWYGHVSTIAEAHTIKLKEQGVDVQCTTDECGTRAFLPGISLDRALELAERLKPKLEKETA